MISKNNPNHNKIEWYFEWILWNTRFLVLIPVLIGIAVFVVLIVGIIGKFLHLLHVVMHSGFVDEALSLIISILDVSLLAVIILIFSWGIYELFVSKIDLDDEHIKKAKTLIITNIDELKEKIGKVIIILLIVWLFKQMILQHPTTKLDLLLISIAILVMALSLKFISKL